MGRTETDTGSGVWGNHSVLCGIMGASAKYLLVWAVPFRKQMDQVERTQRRVKIVTRGLENVTYRDRSEALGTVKDVYLQRDTATRMNVPCSLWQMGHQLQLQT